MFGLLTYIMRSRKNKGNQSQARINCLLGGTKVGNSLKNLDTKENCCNNPKLEHGCFSAPDLGLHWLPPVCQKTWNHDYGYSWPKSTGFIIVIKKKKSLTWLVEVHTFDLRENCKIFLNTVLS